MSVGEMWTRCKCHAKIDRSPPFIVRKLFYQFYGFGMLKNLALELKLYYICWQNPAISDVYTEHSCAVNVAKYSPSGFYIASGG